METELLTEVWQVDAGGEIYETEFEALKQWIAEGSLLPQDKVRRGNLRWIEAQKVPALRAYFNDQESGSDSFSSETSNQSAFEKTNESFSAYNETPKIEQSQVFIDAAQRESCLVHTETKPTYICMACANVFCGECPQSFGNTVKVCPMCGGMCNFIKDILRKEQNKVIFHHASNEGFGFIDLKRAFEYPFKFRTSLMWGTLVFTFAYIGQNAYKIGGLWLISASVFSWLLTNMLTFGILAHTVENMLQGRINQDFLPKFEDFSLWDDAIHPLILILSSYIASFGVFILVCAVSFFLIANSIKSNKNNFQIINDRVQAAKLQANYIKQQTESVEKQAQGANTSDKAETNFIVNEQNTEDIEKLINDAKQQQLAQNNAPNFFDFSSLFQQLMGSWGLPLILLMAISFIWGIFYFPMSMIVASYTRKVSMTLNPLIGIDTIKRLGFDYVKILFFNFLLYLGGGVISLIIMFVLAPLNLEGYINFPGLILTGIVSFYLSVVFSTLIGLALYKNLNSLPLYQATPRY